MASVQELYFRILARACAAMSGHSDDLVALAFGRLGRTLALMDLRLCGTGSLTLDRKGSGLPILNEAVSLMLDLRNGVPRDDDPEVVRQEMLDHMLGRRRMPGPDLVRRMGRAVYADAVSRAPPDVFDTEPSDVAFGTAPWGGLTYGAWDFWDGVASTPVSVRCGFEIPGEVPGDAGREAAASGRLFSGVQFKPVTLACDLDERIPAMRLKELVKLRLGPFRSPVFTEPAGPFSAFLDAVDDPAMAWTLSFGTETLRSAGTVRKKASFWRFAQPVEMFAVDAADPDRAARGVSEFEEHVLMPHAVYQAVADDPAGAAALRERRVHVLSGPECTLSEDV